MSLSLNSEVLGGRYRTDSLIAYGGMGEVWRAVDLVLDRPVAVKVLQPEFAQHPDVLDRFRGEARHAAGLSHPAIAQVYDFGESRDGKPPFLVMELVDGQPLTSLLESGPLEPGRTLDVIAQVAAGLAVAHAAGVVHRDIKPGNLLVDERGGVKITDFGIAHAVGSAPLTRTGMVMGTPAYLAPERVGGAAAGPASDLYSLGMVAYHCLAGELPFTGTALEIALAQRSETLPPLPDSVPAPVANLVASLTARDPAMRPASAAQVAATAAALRADLSGEGATAVGPAVRAARATPGATMVYDQPHVDAGSPGAPAGDDNPTRFLASQPEPAGPMWPPDGQYGARRSGSRRSALLAIAAAIILVACIGGWVLASSLSSGRPTGAGKSAGSHTPAGTVLVRTSALIGKPVHLVARRLKGHGLSVTIAWAPAGTHRPGTVIWVSPSGRLRPGASVRLIAARRPHHGHGQDHGHGHGQNGNGQNGGGD